MECNGATASSETGGVAPAAPTRVVQARVACSGPYRMHVVRDGSEPPCGCGRQHVILGREYLYCTCGHAPQQPWCDGASCVPPFAPTVLRVDTMQTYILVCGCKRTSDKTGLCDGSHSTKVDAAALQW